MARNWPALPAYDTREGAEQAAPRGWFVHQIESLYEQLPIGRRFEQKRTLHSGVIPVIDQSDHGIIGWHNEKPGITASVDCPVVTFANHTCEMRLMRRPFSVIQNVFPLVGRADVCTTEFLYYGTKGRVHLEEYKGHYPDYRRKWIPVPSLDGQRFISHILGTLDNKVELNRRANETMEAMMRALFKSWFVDFDPVRAKAEGRQPPTMDVQTATLFPTELVDSAFGPIPNGWRAGTISDLATLNPESWSRSTYPPTVRYVDLTGTKWGRIETIAEYSRDSAPSRAQRILRIGDTLVGTVRPGNGSYALVTESDLTASTGFAVLRPKRDAHTSIVYLAATRRENIERLAHLADGGAYPAVKPDTVAATPVVVPPDHILMRFEEVLRPLHTRVASNNQCSAALRKLRDALLPRLLSGELPIPDAERLAEATA